MDTIVIPARTGAAVPLRKGEAIRIINTLGGQVVDMWSFAKGADEHLSMPHSVVTLGRIKPLPGDTLYTQLREPILLLEEDRSPGVHCMLFAACDQPRYRLMGHQGFHDNCADNLRKAVQPLGIALPYIPTPLNLFMNTKFNEHRHMEVEAPEAVPGASVTFRALRDCTMAFSACPQDLIPVNAHGNTPQPVAYQVLA